MSAQGMRTAAALDAVSIWPFTFISSGKYSSSFLIGSQTEHPPLSSGLPRSQVLLAAGYLPVHALLWWRMVVQILSQQQWQSGQLNEDASDQ